jgi:DNA topoisomerase-1
MISKLLAKYLIKQQFGGEFKWNSLCHNGVLFPSYYKPLGLPLKYNDETIILKPEAEEYLLYYVKYLDSDYIKRSQFNKNFWHDWKKLCDPKIKSLQDCDLSAFIKYAKKEKENKLENKDKLKDIRKTQEEQYKIAYLDGIEQPVGNFRIEPPGIFIGRGNHPKLGKIKKRIFPEDITINIDKKCPIPQIASDYDGHKWGSIIHDNSVEWLAAWKDDISGKTKYVWLGSNSILKTKSDLEKFELARKLANNIEKIRNKYNKDMKSEDKLLKQLATCLYFIDNLALRVGNEKGSDEVDTVGVTSLRCEHVTLLSNNRIKLDFYGKDVIRYINEIEVNDIVYNNLKSFMEGKNKDDDLFDKITSNSINKYLQELMRNLTAKVFRTYNSSLLLQEELDIISKKFDKYDKPDKIQHLLDSYNSANAKVAKLCNHQKNQSKGFKSQINKIYDRIGLLKEKKEKYKDNKKKNKKINELINKLKRKIQIKKELKDLSLGTSKTNYIDPRITVAFMKKFNLPINKIFTQTLQQKFAWAFEIEEGWHFN